jgi:uncharacterized protein YaaN involved in tellurite resistance
MEASMKTNIMKTGRNCKIAVVFFTLSLGSGIKIAQAGPTGEMPSLDPEAAGLSSPIGLATTIQSFLSDIPAMSNDSLDTGALLSNLRKDIGKDVPSQVFARMALMKAMTTPEHFSAIRGYLLSAKTPKQPHLGQEAVATMKTWFDAVQNNPGARHSFIAAQKNLAPLLTYTGKLDADKLKTLFDGGITQTAKEEDNMEGAMVDEPTRQAGVTNSTAKESGRLKPFEPTKPAPSQTLLELTVNKVSITPASTDGDLATVEDHATEEEKEEANRYVDALVRLDPSDFRQREQGSGGAESYGLKLQEEAADQSGALKVSLKEVADTGANGGDIVRQLFDLRRQVEALDPIKVNFTPGVFRRALGRIPLVGLPVSRFTSRFESAQTVIDGIFLALKESRLGLLKKNESLQEDQHRMIDVMDKLDHAIAKAKLVDQKLEERLKDPESDITPEQRKFLTEEVLFRFRQRIVDLETQHAVNNQAAVASGILIANNRELAAGVNRTLNTIPTALRAGVTLALALHQQMGVLNAMEATNKTGAALITRNALLIKTQGAEIQKRASKSTIPVEVFKEAFVNLMAALQDVSTFHQTALPELKNEINKLGEMITTSKTEVGRMLLAEQYDETAPKEIGAAPQRQIAGKTDQTPKVKE